MIGQDLPWKYATSEEDRAKNLKAEHGFSDLVLKLYGGESVVPALAAPQVSCSKPVAHVEQPMALDRQRAFSYRTIATRVSCSNLVAAELGSTAEKFDVRLRVEE